MTSLDELNQWLQNPEDAGLEYAEAKNGYDERDLMEQCAAIANEHGGKFILGVAPPRVVGTKAFAGTLEKLQHELLQQLDLRIEVEEKSHPDGRVLIFHIPRHRPRTPVRYNGRYRMRVGPVNKDMDAETLRKICNEYDEDFSACIVPGLTLDDLDEKAVRILKERRASKAKRPELATVSTERTLCDLRLLTREGLTFAALILLGKREKIVELLPQAEIIYEWRGDPGQISCDDRKEWRDPYLSVTDEIWETITIRNIRTPYQQGFDVPLEIPAFDEDSCREAVNNAIAHREYRNKGTSIFIRCSPRSFSVVSPGGFPEGVTPENALDRTIWRNPRIAEVLQHVGFVERSGQGLDRIFEKNIRQGKGKPDFEGTDNYEVHLNIPSQISDPTFVRYLERVANEKQIVFSLEELLELEHIRREGKVLTPSFRDRFLDLGIVEQHGKTRGARYMLAHQYFRSVGQIGKHSRLVGLTRDVNKETIRSHIQRNRKGSMNEFIQAFPGLKRQDISNILQDLRRDGYIEHIGPRNRGFWVLKKLDLNKSKIVVKDQFNGFSKPNK